MSGRSIVEYFAEHEKYRCGYCGQKDTNYSHGMWTHSLTVEDYQALIDRGWRRSGKYTYKPTMNQTCCPQYAIRCDATKFKLSKSHKKVIKRVNKFLNTGVRPEREEKDAEERDSSGVSQVQPGMDKKGTENVGLDPAAETTNTAGVKHTTRENRSAGTGRQEKPKNCDTVGKVSDSKQSQPTKKSPKPGVGADPRKPPCKKSKEQRIARWKEKQARKPSNLTAANDEEQAARASKNNPKSLEDLLNETVENPAHKLELRLVRSNPRSDEFTRTFSAAYAVYKSYQMRIHRDPPDKPSEKQYTRFLVDSPLQSCGEKTGFPGYGSFHQQYLLDGEIIAVGVVDILPSCVSSVYLYYNPNYSFLSLGTYSALRELAFVRELQKVVPALHYYYMGFYIHSCPKMRYKGQYVPSFILCPEVYTFQPIEEVRPKLDASKYSRLAEPGKVDEDGDLTLGDVLTLHQRTAMPYAMYRQFSEAEDEEEVLEYAGYVGKTCAERMLLFRA